MDQKDINERAELSEILIHLYSQLTMSGLESWAREYEGPQKNYVQNIVRALGGRNSRACRVFCLDKATIKELEKDICEAEKD